MADSLNPALLLCPLWPKQPLDCLAQCDSEPEPEQEPVIKPDPEPELKTVPEPEHSDSIDRSVPPPEPKPPSVYHAWLASRVPSCQNAGYISAGAQRPLTRATLRLAQRIAELCVPQILQIFWSQHPFRAFVMVAFSFVRGTFPVFKGYTHALIINEGSRLINSSYPVLTDPPLYSDSILILFRSLHVVPFDSPPWGRFIALCCRKIVRLICVSFTYFLTCGRVEI
jgi:hypothetical protein